MQSQVLEIDERFGKEYAGEYVFREISWARRNRIIQRHTKYSQATGQVVSSDYVAVQAETIWASLKEQPQSKPITLERLLSDEEGVPTGLGELFSQIVTRLNGLDAGEVRFLSEQSAGENPAQSSPTSGFARNSAGPPDNSPSSQPKLSNSSSQSSAS